LSGAWINKANLSSCTLTNADLSGASLYAADLTGAHLSGAHLYGVNLVGADLGGANLRGANLQGALLLAEDFDLAQLYDGVISELNEADQESLYIDANLCGVQYDDQTRWPDGFAVPPCAVLTEHEEN
jgi:uncharacterized protein YjbI with pentapeptide repeats